MIDPNTKISIILNTFGLQSVNAKIFRPPFPLKTGVQRPDYLTIVPEESDTPVATSFLGTPIFSNIEIKAGKYFNNDGKEIEYEGMTIDTVLFDVSQEKLIVKTEVSGRNGTVKEYISDGDYDITIRGVLVDRSPNKYPYDQVNALLEICKAQASISAASVFLQQFSIHSLVIESYNFPQREGFYNTQPFEIQCVSDEPVELNLSGP